MTDHGTLLALLFGDQPYFGGATMGHQTSVLENLFMSGLVSQIAAPDKPLHILEIGSWLGFSALTWAHAIKQFCPAGGEVVCVDPHTPYVAPSDRPQRTLGAMERLIESGLAYDLFQHNIACGPREVPIRHLRLTTRDAVARLAGRRFDIIFVDGSHYYDDVHFDLTASLALLSERGVLCGDDLDLQIGEVAEEFAAQHTNSDSATDPRSGEQFHPGVALAVHRVLGRVFCLSPFWSMRKTAAGFEPIDPRRGAVMIPDHFTPDMKAEAHKFIVGNQPPQ